MFAILSLASSLCADTGRGPVSRAPDSREWSSREEENGRGELSSIAPPDMVRSAAVLHSDVQ